MANILLGVTGSVAAIYTPELYRALTAEGHAVKVVATASSLYFFDSLLISPQLPGKRDNEAVVLDEDEWPGAAYRRGDPVLHIELRRWADLFLIAPLDAHTLAKLSQGMCDNVLSCVYRAWDREKPIILAPAMNTLMWEHPATSRQLAQVAADVGSKFHLVEPIAKKLACEDVGLGAMAERSEIVAAVARAL